MRINTSTSAISKFNSYAAAKRYQQRARKIEFILLGDDGLYWVTTPRLAFALEKAGYEIID